MKRGLLIAAALLPFLGSVSFAEEGDEAKDAAAEQKSPLEISGSIDTYYKHGFNDHGFDFDRGYYPTGSYATIGINVDSVYKVFDSEEEGKLNINAGAGVASALYDSSKEWGQVVVSRDAKGKKNVEFQFYDNTKRTFGGVGAFEYNNLGYDASFGSWSNVGRKFVIYEANLDYTHKIDDIEANVRVGRFASKSGYLDSYIEGADASVDLGDSGKIYFIAGFRRAYYGNDSVYSFAALNPAHKYNIDYSIKLDETITIKPSLYITPGYRGEKGKSSTSLITQVLDVRYSNEISEGVTFNLNGLVMALANQVPTVTKEKSTDGKEKTVVTARGGNKLSVQASIKLKEDDYTVTFGARGYKNFGVTRTSSDDNPYNFDGTSDESFYTSDGTYFHRKDAIGAQVYATYTQGNFTYDIRGFVATQSRKIGEATNANAYVQGGSKSGIRNRISYKIDKVSLFLTHFLKNQTTLKGNKFEGAGKEIDKLSKDLSQDRSYIDLGVTYSF